MDRVSGTLTVEHVGSFVHSSETPFKKLREHLTVYGGMEQELYMGV